VLVAHEHEARKYEQMWSRPEYRQVAPGEHFADHFIRLSRPMPSETVYDFGCGTGRGALRIHRRTGATVVAFDFTPNCLDAEVAMQVNERFVFKQHDLTVPFDVPMADYGYCTDVMEHVPPQDVDAVLRNITKSAEKVFFAISTVDDVMGALIGEPLHLTVRDPYWWHDKLEAAFFRVDWSEATDNAVFFYGSAYANGDDIMENSKLNVEEDVVRKNVHANLALGLQELVPHQTQPDKTVYLLAGGPSLADFEKQIIEAGSNGTPVVTVNGTYNWLIERGIRPAAQVMVDARGFNKRFLEPRISTCKYLISSQCDNETVKALPPEQTWLWHSGDSALVKEVFNAYAEETGVGREWYPVYGGSTVITRALTLLAMLGFRKIEVFGWDSCLRESTHHAYAQPENDADGTIEVTMADRTFKCHPWMAVQANEFPKLVQRIYSKIDDFELVVHGDGLISHMLQHSADLAKGI
jgi:SAM-dependent methyltransferase